jgi:hypothetical protein
MQGGNPSGVLLLACAVVAVTIYAANTLFLAPQQRGSQQIEAVEALALEVEKLNGRYDQLLENQLSVQKSLAGLPSGPAIGNSTSQPDARLFASKLAEIEQELVSIRRSQEQVAVHEPLTARVDREALSEIDAANRIGQALYEADYGPPPQGQEALLSSAFDSAGIGGSDAQVSCKSTVCKVTYRSDEAGANALPGVASLDDRLIGELTEGYGRDLRIHHATDESGNQVMYIQERR